jgi:hypothetical protein
VNDPTVPPESFDEDAYLAANPDVAQAVHDRTVVSGWYHVLFEGHREGRPGLPVAVRTLVQDYWRGFAEAVPTACRRPNCVFASMDRQTSPAFM